MVQEQRARDGRLVLYFCRLVELLLPTLSSFDRQWVAGVRHYYATGYVSGVQWLEGGAGVPILALVPELHANFLTLNFHDLKREVRVAVQVFKVTRFWIFLRLSEGVRRCVKNTLILFNELNLVGRSFRYNLSSFKIVVEERILIFVRSDLGDLAFFEYVRLKDRELFTIHLLQR